MAARAGAPSKLPSAGFAAIVVVHLALVSFLAWGFQEPPLDRVWELRHRLRIGEVGALKPKDRVLLTEAMQRHAELASALLPEGVIGVISAHTSGWLETPEATIIRSKGAKNPCLVKFEVSMPDEALPITVKFTGDRWSQDFSIKRQGLSSFTLPPAKSAPEVIGLELSTSGSHDEVATLGVRVDFACEADSKPKRPRIKAEVDD